MEIDVTSQFHLWNLSKNSTIWGLHQLIQTFRNAFLQLWLFARYFTKLYFIGGKCYLEIVFSGTKRTQYLKSSPEKWVFENLLGHQDSYLLAENGLEQISLLLAPLWSLDLALGHISEGKGALLIESCAANGSMIGLKEHRWHWIRTWFSQFLWLVFFPHGIFLASKRPRALSWPSLHGIFVSMEACINLRQIFTCLVNTEMNIKKHDLLLQ